MRQGYIYYILDLSNADMYIGSCWKERWRQRKSAHKQMEEITCASINIINNNNYIFEILEENEFIDQKDRFKREQYYIDNNKCINNQRAYRSQGYIKDYKKEYNKQYRIKHREKLINYNREYNKKNNERKKLYDEKRKVKVCCIKCKKEMTKGSLNRHIKNVHKI